MRRRGQHAEHLVGGAMSDVMIERLLKVGDAEIDRWTRFWTKRDRVNWKSSLPEMDIQTQRLPQR